MWLHCSVGEPMEDEELAAETLREAAAAGGGGMTSGGLEGVRCLSFSSSSRNSAGLNSPNTITYTSVLSLGLPPKNRHSNNRRNN